MTKFLKIYFSLEWILFFILFMFGLNPIPCFSNIPESNPNYFKQNLGQIYDSESDKRNDVLFYSKANGFKVYLRKGGISYVFYKPYDNVFSNNSALGLEPDISSRSDVNFDEFYNRTKNLSLIQWRIDLDFVNCNESFEIIKEGESSDFENFYLKDCPQGIKIGRAHV